MSSEIQSSADPTDRPPDEFQELLGKARTGDQDACQQLYDRYRGAVLRVVRRYMDQRLRKLLDSTDLTQDVWLSVFRDAPPGPDFACPAQFLKYLEAVAQNKTLERGRRQIETQKRSLVREEPIGRRAEELRDPAEDPAEQAATDDDWAYLQTRLSDGDRAAVEGLRAGEGLEALARRLDISVKNLRRVARRGQRVLGR